MIFRPTKPDPCVAYVPLGEVIAEEINHPFLLSDGRGRLVSFMRACPGAIVVQHRTTGELQALAPDALDVVNQTAFWRGVLILFNEPRWTRGDWDRSMIHIRKDRVEVFRAEVLGHPKLPPPAAVLEPWYRAHALRNPQSTETEDWQAAKAQFGPSIKRDTIRSLRRDSSMRPFHVRKRRGRPLKNSAWPVD